jgi:hypothetical protein
MTFASDRESAERAGTVDMQRGNCRVAVFALGEFAPNSAIVASLRFD